MNKANTKLHQVSDTLGHSYLLTSKLGQGGQGSVWRTDQAQVLIKQLTVQGCEQRQHAIDQLIWLMRQRRKIICVCHDFLACVLVTCHLDKGYTVMLRDV